MNDLNRMAGNVHKFEVLPGHFEPGANRKYHYKRRTTKYLKWKEKKYPGRPDLVAKGDLKEKTLHNAVVTATWQRWRLYVRKAADHQIPGWMRDEIERVNQTEIDASCRMIGKGYKQYLPQYLRKRKVKG